MNIHPDLLIAQNKIYEPNGLHLRDLHHHKESKEYGACTFTLNTHPIEFRISKITPTKTGQFVTLWKRIGNGPIMPYDVSDQVDYFIVSVREKQRLGHFIFPKKLLQQKGYISQNGIGGKRAMRVYPPWVITDSTQAQKTQAWQQVYFVEIEPNIDNARLLLIYSKSFDR